MRAYIIYLTQPFEKLPRPVVSALGEPLGGFPETPRGCHGKEDRGVQWREGAEDLNRLT